MDSDISLSQETSNTVDVEFGNLIELQNKSMQHLKRTNIPLTKHECCDEEVGTMNCLLCSYSNVSTDKVKCHIFSQHPTEAASALRIHDSETESEGEITFFCVKERCEYSATVCNDYEKHLTSCMNLNERLSLSDELKERLRSSIKFVLDFHARQDIKATLEFEDFVSSFIHFYKSGNKFVTPLSHCMKGTHLDTDVLQTSDSVSQNLEWIKSETLDSHDQVSVSERENENVEAARLNGSTESIFPATVKKESHIAESLVDHLVSGNPDLENNIDGDSSLNTNNDFFSKETNNLMKAEEIGNCQRQKLPKNKKDFSNIHNFITQEYVEISKKNINAAKDLVPSGSSHQDEENSYSTEDFVNDLHSCGLCDLDFSSKDLLKKHAQKLHCGDCTFVHKRTNSPHQTCLNEDKAEKSLSKGDDQVQVSSQGRKQITKQNGKMSYKCKECGKTFGQVFHLHNHVKIHEGLKLNKFKCSRCSKMFRIKSQLFTHMKIHKKHFNCKECGQACTGKRNLKVHMMLHTGEKSYVCTECGLTFCWKSDLDKHMRIHTDEKLFKCGECSQTFRSKSNLSEHMMIHTGEKPFKCEECNQTFGRKGNLNNHMKIHTGEKPFKCGECGCLFRHKNSLTSHMKIHTGEKPFKCEECGKSFGQTSTLNNHMKIHTGERPFKCKECCQTFRRKSYLNSHMKIHTGEKPFKCKECSQAFGRKSYLRDHMRKHACEKPLEDEKNEVKPFLTEVYFSYI